MVHRYSYLLSFLWWDHRDLGGRGKLVAFSYSWWCRPWDSRGIVTIIPEPPSLLLNPLKYSRLTLLLGTRHHKLGGKVQPRVGKNNCAKAIKRNKRKLTAAQQLLLKRGHHGLPVPMHGSSTNTLPLWTWNSDCTEMPTLKLKGNVPQEWPNRSRGLNDGRKVIWNILIHSNIADQLCFLAYATTNLVGRCNRELAKITALRPSGGMRENSWLPNNSYSNEVITAFQYPCMAVVQIPSLCEPGILTALKCLL